MIIFIGYLEKGRNMNGEYYANLLQGLAEEIKLKRPPFAKKKVLFLQGNAPAHKSVILITNINELKFELLLHALYSPDLAPSDYFLCPNLKKWLSDQRFSNDEEVLSAVNGYFNEHKGIELIEHRWEKCLELKEDYTEQ